MPVQRAGRLNDPSFRSSFTASKGSPITPNARILGLHGQQLYEFPDNRPEASLAAIVFGGLTLSAVAARWQAIRVLVQVNIPATSGTAIVSLPGLLSNVVHFGLLIDSERVFAPS